MLKIECSDVRKFRAELALPQPAVVRAGADGTIVLRADDAEMHGNQVRVEEREGAANVGFWDRGDEWVSWRVQIAAPGSYRVAVECGALEQGVEFVVDGGADTLAATAPVTGSWSRFGVVDAGVVRFAEPGLRTVAIRPRDPARWRPMNLRSVRLTPAG